MKLFKELFMKGEILSALLLMLNFLLERSLAVNTYRALLDLEKRIMDKKVYKSCFS